MSRNRALWLLGLLLTTALPASAGTKILLIARDNEKHLLPGFIFAYQGVESTKTNRAGAAEIALPPEHPPGRRIEIQLVTSPKMDAEWFLVNPQINIPEPTGSAEIVLMRRSNFRDVAFDVLDRQLKATPDRREPTDEERNRVRLDAAARRGLTPDQLEAAIRSFGETKNPKDKGIAAYLAGHYDQAEGFLAQAIEKEQSDFFETLRYLRDTQEQKGQHDAANKTTAGAAALVTERYFLDVLRPDSDLFALNKRYDMEMAMLAPWEKVEPGLRKRLTLTENRYGPSHPAVARDLDELAGVLTLERRFAEAESLYRRALQIYEQRNPTGRRGGPEAAIASVIGELADLLVFTNRLSEAEPLFRRKLIIDQGRYPRNHPEVARDLSNLACLLRDSNRLSEAEPLMRQSLQTISSFAQQNGMDDPLKMRDYRDLFLAINLRYQRLLRKMGKSEAEVNTTLSEINYPLSQLPQTISLTVTIIRIGILCFACAIVLWAVSLISHNVRIANFFWGPLLVLATLIARQGAGRPGIWQSIHLVMVAIWALRLITTFGWQRRSDEGYWNYSAMQKLDGHRLCWISLIRVFILQGALVTLLSAPLVIVQLGPVVWPAGCVVGATVWLAGFFLEVIAGYQSLAFQERAPSGGRKGLDYWLWHLYHHPRNYGEIFLWLGYSAFALSVPSGIWTIYAPVVISLLLLIETSGVPLLEAEGLIPSSVA